MVTIFNSDEPKKALLSKDEPCDNVSNPGNFSLPILRLVKKYREYFDSQTKSEIAVIFVDDIASKVAFFYEKIRKIVDWKEEHLVRRAAIERVLKRKMISEISGISLVLDFSPKKIAEPLVLELIRGGHFPNGKIPKSKIGDVQKILEKYSFILENNPLAKEASPNIKKKINLYNWILEIAACEIEEALEFPIREKALMKCMVSLMDERVKIIPPNFMSEEEKRVQLYIAVHRTLFHLDAPIISYHLLKTYWPGWNSLDKPSLEKISKNIFLVQKEIGKKLSHSLSGKFFRICEKYDTIYLLLGDIFNSFSKKPAKITEEITKPKDLTSLIKKVYQKRISTLKERLYRAAIYSTLSIFVSSAVSLYIIEVPLAKLFYGNFSLSAIAVDILIPTALMAFLVLIVKPPKEGNLKRVITETVKVVYETEEKDVYEIKAYKKKRSIVNAAITILYLLGTVSSLGLVYWVFRLAKIPVTSLYIDTLNVAMIVFAALVIKQRAKELTIEERTSFWEFSIDIISVPMAKIGQWLANKWKEYNLVSVFFIALIDMPFSTFIGFIESWSSFLKEKKAEIH